MIKIRAVDLYYRRGEHTRPGAVGVPADQ
jgi:hypothetical protein